MTSEVAFDDTDSHQVRSVGDLRLMESWMTKQLIFLKLSREYLKAVFIKRSFKKKTRSFFDCTAIIERVVCKYNPNEVG